MDGPVEALQDILAESVDHEQSLVVVNRTEVDPIHRLFQEAFAGQSVAIDEAAIPSVEDNVVVLVRDGAVVAASPLDQVIDACLLVNSDLYRTGMGGIDKHDAPSVITELDETVFDLRGFPESNKEKLLLVVISRFIERLALDCGEGRLRATFQRLSRLSEETGTRRVYERLGETAVETHVYGQGTLSLSTEMQVMAHSGDHRGFKETWCVVFVPSESDERHAALVALETGTNEWRGTWTYDPEKVRRIDEIIETTF